MFGTGQFGLSTFGGTLGDIRLKRFSSVTAFSYQVANLFHKETDITYNVYANLTKIQEVAYVVFGKFNQELTSKYTVLNTLNVTTEFQYITFNGVSISKQFAWFNDPRMYPYIYENKAKDSPDKEIDYLTKHSIDVVKNDKVVLSNKKAVRTKRKGTVKL